MKLQETKKKKIIRAGVIPFFIKDKKLEMLFMKPSDPKYGGAQWQIAKGEIDEGEAIIKAALREGKEELGLLRSNIDQLFSLGSFWNGAFHLFAVTVKSKKKFAKFGEETGAVRWMNWGEIFTEGRREQIKLVSTAYKVIKAGV